MSEPPDRVAVVVPVRDDPAVVRTARAILTSLGGAEADVIVVNHRSAPTFAEVLGWLPIGVRVIESDAETVYGARNDGVAGTDARVIFFTDADCTPVAGWVAEGLSHIEAGADIVQGFSGTDSPDRRARLLQVRYEAHLRNLAPGQPTESDTRNLAARRELLLKNPFNAAWRRTSDTEFGLLAERMGARIDYCPAMRVQHAHNPDLRVFAAKQICHGWGAQRIMREHPDIAWHGGHLKLVARVSHSMGPRRWNPVVTGLLARGAIAGAAMIERTAAWLPLPVAIAGLTAVDKAAAMAGHLMYESGAPEPRPSVLAGREVLD